MKHQHVVCLNDDPRQCLFDGHRSATVQANLHRMQIKYGFSLSSSPKNHNSVVEATTTSTPAAFGTPSSSSLEDLIAHCHEKIQVDRKCLYCHRTFYTPQACRRHMIAKRHTKLPAAPTAAAQAHQPFQEEEGQEALAKFDMISLVEDDDDALIITGTSTSTSPRKIMNLIEGGDEYTLVGLNDSCLLNDDHVNNEDEWLFVSDEDEKVYAEEPKAQQREAVDGRPEMS